MKKLFAITATMLALMLVTAPLSLAAEFIAPQGESGSVTLGVGETHRNVYVAGGSVVINSDVSGDLFMAGGNISVVGSVEQDATVAGGNITLNGKIGGDLRIAGGNITVNGPIAGDVLMAGGTLHLTEKASIGGDLYAAGGDVVLDATVAGAVNISGGRVVLNSAIPGKVKITAGESLTIASKAVIPSGIMYRGVNEAVLTDGAQVGSIDYQKIQQKNHIAKKAASIFTLAFIIKIIGLFIAGLIVLKLFPKTSVRALQSMQNGMWKNLGIGFLTLVVGPIAFLIALVTIIGIYIAFVWLLIWILLLLAAVLVTNIFVGAWLIKMLSSARTEMIYDWRSLAIGTVAVAVLAIIPFIGSLVYFVLMLMAFGGIIRQLYAHIHEEQNSGPALNY